MNLPRIAPSEWAVMKVLWEQEDRSAAEVIAALEPESDWHPKTVRTLLDRLAAKGAVARVKRAGCYRYSPCVREADCVREEGRSFLKRFFGGGLHPMLAHFLDESEVSEEELAELRKLLEAKAKEGGAS